MPSVEETLGQELKVYINLVEHPARMGLATRRTATQRAPSYKRANWMQAPLAPARPSEEK
jgi:hypothetical protein